PALLGELPEDVVGLVARDVGEGGGPGVGGGDGRARCLDRLARRLPPGVADVDEDPLLVHAGDEVASERLEPAVRGNEAAVADEVGAVVGELDDPNPKAMEQLEALGLVPDGRRVLEAEDNPDLAL